MKPANNQGSSPERTIKSVNLAFIVFILLLIAFEGDAALAGIAIVSVLLELYNLISFVYHIVKKNGEASYINLNFLIIVPAVGILSGFAWFALHFTKFGG